MRGDVVQSAPRARRETLCSGLVASSALCFRLFFLLKMPSLCAVSGCSSLYNGQHSMQFHRFPREEALREKWIISLCMNPGAINSNNARICHFNASDYERHLKYELLQLPVPRKLESWKLGRFLAFPPYSQFLISIWSLWELLEGVCVQNSGDTLNNWYHAEGI